MDSRTFFIVLIVGIAFVAVQGLLSLIDGRFSQGQLDADGIGRSWSFLQHGGMWADVFIISPLVALVLSTYRLDHASYWGIGTIVFSAAFTIAMVMFYQQMGKTMGDHCTHDGYTTVAGWIHAIYAFAAIWILLEVFLGLTTPVVSARDIKIIATLLTPFFALGVVKFSREWSFSTQDILQSVLLPVGVWILAAIRMYA